jgi:hypothetical protein
MTIYTGRLSRDGRRPVVFVDQADDDGVRIVSSLTHRKRHSPTGLAWGYCGSGPADLARSILWHHFGREPVEGCYQAFKSDVVARWREGLPWQITTTEVDDWLAGYRGVRYVWDPDLDGVA